MLSDGPDDPARELRRVVDRLVTLGPDRLSRPGEDDVTPHQRVQRWLQDLADATADAVSSGRRRVPVLRPHGVPDQVVVLVHEALAAGAPDVAERLVALRRSV